MHYVYELWDPRTDRRFYVGKGQGDRAYQHQRQVLNGTARSNPAKIKIINEILAAGRQVEVRFVAEYAAEDDALDHEFHLVDSDPTLTNIAPGGIRVGAISPLILARSRLKRLRELLTGLKRIKSNNTQTWAVSRLKEHYDKNRRIISEKDAAELEEWNRQLPQDIRKRVRVRGRKFAWVDPLNDRIEKTIGMIREAELVVQGLRRGSSTLVG